MSTLAFIMQSAFFIAVGYKIAAPHPHKWKETDGK